jgi:hypothetical protein
VRACVCVCATGEGGCNTLCPFFSPALTSFPPLHLPICASPASCFHATLHLLPSTISVLLFFSIVTRVPSQNIDTEVSVSVSYYLTVFSPHLSSLIAPHFRLFSLFFFFPLSLSRRFQKSDFWLVFTSRFLSLSTGTARRDSDLPHSGTEDNTHTFAVVLLLSQSAGPFFSFLFISSAIGSCERIRIPRIRGSG